MKGMIPMQQITPEQASELAFQCLNAGTIQHAADLFYYHFARRYTASHLNNRWSTMCAAAAVYNAGRIDGIRQERAKRRRRA